MAIKLPKLLSLVFFSTILDYPVTTISQECPYPCYPPPIGPGNNPTVGTTPAVPNTPPASFSPPIFTTPPSAGYFPFTPPSPYYFGVTPPPPEPMVSWFPFYYRKPPHQDEQSSSLALKQSRNIVVIMFPLLGLLIFSFL